MRKFTDNPDPKERLFENSVLGALCLHEYEWAKGMCQAWRIATGTEYVLSTNIASTYGLGVDDMEGVQLVRIYYEDDRRKAEIIVAD